MAQAVREIMTSEPITIKASQTVVDAARAMRDADIGPVLVMDDGAICGIITDRDIVVRTIAEGKDPKKVKAREICSAELVCVGPDDDVDEAVRLMRDRAIRRVPVVDEGSRPVGVVSLGDLAQWKDPHSALADISKAPPNS